MNTASSQVESDYSWQVVAPPSGIPDTSPFPEASLGFIRKLSEFRGRILHANGRRPRFVRAGGEYMDDDPLDLESFHVTVRADGTLIGCVRVTPLPEYSRSFIGERIGPSCLAASVNVLNLARTDCVEAGRWIVAPSARGTVLGRILLLSLGVIGGNGSISAAFSEPWACGMVSQQWPAAVGAGMGEGSPVSSQ